VFWTVTTVIVLGLGFLAVFVKRVELGPAIAVGVVLGGGVGNVVDRFVRAPGIARGEVVDWIAVDPYPRVFNFADVALRAGAVALVVAALIRGRRVPVTQSRLQ